MAARIAQIRLSPYSSRPPKSTKKDRLNHTSSPTKVKPLRGSMYQAPRQHDCMAYPPAKPQQAGARQPNHISHNQENAVRQCAGGARDLPQTPRKSHRQDRQREANVMKTLPRQPKSRQPLHEMSSSHSVGEQRTSSIKHPTESEHLVDIIDDYLSKQANHSPNTPRPSSSGTMFVDFRADGQVEVSYRNGINKRLPTPLVPSKIPETSKPASPRQTVEIKQHSKRTKREERTETGMMPRSKRPSQPSRHDSVINPSANYSIDLSLPPPFPPPNRPLPPLPVQNPVKAQTRRSYPPQVHSTSRTVSTTKMHCFSPTLSTTTYHTARDEAEGVYTVIEPDGMTASYQSGGLTTSFTLDPAAYAQAARVKSQAESQKIHYLDIPVPTHRSTPNAPHASIHASPSYVPLKKMNKNKPLPPLPPACRSQEPNEARVEKKRHKVARFVKKVLQKIEGRR
ncbi:hypothetical protein E8E11_002404 [Didymella keratinophila]|nr:hypothetical protein E8E11_002404 [Didymella keratinophila]